MGGVHRDGDCKESGRCGGVADNELQSGVQQMGAKEPDDPMAFVKHEFEGTYPLWEQHVIKG